MRVQARVEKREDGNYNIIAKCVICGSEHAIENVTAMQIFMYEQGAFVQDAFPEVEPALRELLVSGTCGKCWNEMLGLPPEAMEG